MKQSLLTNNFVYIDYRERALIDLLKHRLPLISGNYPVDVIVKDIGVERKTGKDLEASIIDDRLFEQLHVLKEFLKRVVIIEGEYSFRLNMRHIMGAVASLISQGISVVYTHNIYETAELIYSLFQDHKAETKLYIPEKKKEPQLATLAGIPGVGKKRAKKLLSHFGSLGKVFSANLEDLQSLLGPNLGKKVYSFIHKKYEEW